MIRQVAGAVLVVLGALSFYAASVLARRTVFGYTYLGFWGVITGVVLVGILLTVTLFGTVALSRGYLRLVALHEGGGPGSVSAALEAVERRRVAASRRLTEPPLSGAWMWLLAVGVVLWVVLFLAPGTVSSISAFEALAAAAWVLVPVSVYFDAKTRAGGVPRRRVRAYVAGSLFPFVAAVFGGAYLVRSFLSVRGRERARSDW